MADFNSNRASFIPKTATATSRKVRKTKRIYILSYISYVLFFGTVVVVLGSYFYGIQVDKALELKKAELLEKEGRFNDSHVQYVTELEERISLAQSFVSKSVAPSSLFTALEDTVADSVVYDSFGYEKNEEGQLVATFSGRTDDFDVSIFQREVIEENDVLGDADVSDFSYGQVSDDSSQSSSNEGTDGVVFTYELILDPETIAYDPSIYTSEPDPVVESPVTTSTSSDSTSNDE